MRNDGPLHDDPEIAALVARREELRRRVRRRRWWRITAFTAALVIGLAAVRGVWVSRDSDGDGITDCQERAGLRLGAGGAVVVTDPRDVETDSDGVPDGEEVPPSRAGGLTKSVADSFWSCSPRTFAALADPTASDSDEDGLPDPVELSEGSNPFRGDSDRDGLADVAEREWGSDPNAADTDGDGRKDGDDADEELSPVLADEPRDEGRWSDEFAEGAWYGEFREIDSVPQLLGAVSGGASSTVPYAGWITGTLADSRDIVANAVHGRWGDAGASGMGLVPYVGDTAKAVKVVSNFARAKPALVRTVVKSIATWDKMPQDAQMALLGATDKASIETLVDHKLSDGQIVKLAKRGALLATVASNLDRHGDQVIAGISAAFADDDGFVLSLEAAEEALRAEVSVEGDAAAKAVYVDQLPAQFRGGRYFSACTRCDEGATPGTSILHVAKLGTQPFNATVSGQVDKDAYLVRRGYTIEWHFFAGPTGLDVDAELTGALDKAGITYRLHLPR
ncbi:hypothetical protein [Nocardioides ganghwensis]|uniref:Uncharacterized protein n=1 Tax=Nocardioides ganghwensis TaxID=252230 RepID=A0A4V1RM64_9ACTN|nr:hypothetical protein [Nocardioides ganghwensis]MBD3947551.1 hypothetical protein [Nocardioides ganghwensis]RYB99429.1 hypothetical protein EUA07_16525 [Nocardioides ganghwensis]